MSSDKAQKLTEKPQPPSVEDILVDLKESAADDVALQSPTPLRFIAADSDQDVSKTLPNQDVKHATNPLNSKDLQSSKKQEEIWTKVLGFLTAHNDLETSKSTLEAFSNDIAGRQSQLRTAANKLKATWESEKAEDSDF